MDTVTINEKCFQPDTVNVISISGGKDSLAMWLLAIENNVNRVVVFADTGHEHGQTYDYIDYLESRLGKVNRVRADFSKEIKRKRLFVENNWPENLIEDALSVLNPTGIPFLDLCLWKGRFPSTVARFCSFELKHKPINTFVDSLLPVYDEVISWQGVRADESPSRAKLPVFETDVNKTPGLSVYRPILTWSVDEVFALAKKHGIKPNPLYQQGCSRVGCMPCIHARKSELAEIFKRFPVEIKRIQEWERLVSLASKRGISTFFTTNRDPANAEKDSNKISLHSHGIETLKPWALTDRGGRQFSIFPDVEDLTVCNSIYAGVCE